MTDPLGRSGERRTRDHPGRRATVRRSSHCDGAVTHRPDGPTVASDTPYRELPRDHRERYRPAVRVTDRSRNSWIRPRSEPRGIPEPAGRCAYPGYIGPPADGHCREGPDLARHRSPSGAEADDPDRTALQNAVAVTEVRRLSSPRAPMTYGRVDVPRLVESPRPPAQAHRAAAAPRTPRGTPPPPARRARAGPRRDPRGAPPPAARRSGAGSGRPARGAAQRSAGTPAHHQHTRGVPPPPAARLDGARPRHHGRGRRGRRGRRRPDPRQHLHADGRAAPARCCPSQPCPA